MSGTSWTANTDVEQQLIEPVNLTGVVMKTVGAKWLVQMHEYLQNNPGLIVNGFRKAGIQEAVDSTNETVTANDSLETVTAINSTDQLIRRSDRDQLMMI